MRPEEIRELLRRQPFVPIRIHITGGKTYDISHPENIIIGRSRVDIGVGGDAEAGVVDHVDSVSLLHIVRIEDLAPARRA
jgi:hypothetical protein